MDLVHLLLLAAAALAVSGILEGGQRLAARRRRRAEADAWILQAGGAFADRRAWRVAELTSPKERRALARSLRGVRLDSTRAPVVGAAAVNRAQMHPHARELEELAERVGDLENPISAYGVLRLRWLLTSPGSPVYAPSWPRGETASELSSIRASLELG
jgi:hypothetical protein